MTNPDLYYGQGDPANEEIDPDVCNECGYTNCQCDAASDYYRE